MSAEWLNAALAVADPAIARIRDVEIDADIPQGMMSDVVRLIPHYEPQAAGNRVPSFAVKLSSPIEAMRKRQSGRFGYFKEVRFYQRLAAQVGLPCAHCFHADVDENTGFHVLLLEDLSHARRYPLRSGCSKPAATLVVLGLAHLHAQWWGRADQPVLDWLADPAPIDAAQSRRRYQAWWPEFVEIAADQLNEPIMEFGLALEGRFAELMNGLIFSAPRTLRHGDYGLSNLLFEADQERPYVVIDWQMIARGKGPWDLAWLLGQSLTIEQRRSWEDELLHVYHAELIDHGVKDYGFENCRRDYRLAIGQRFGSLISSLLALPFSPAQKTEILEVQLPRNIAAIIDHGGAALLDPA